MIPICTDCDGDITSTNRGWPGYCSPACRDSVAAMRESKRRQRAIAHEEVAA